MHISEFIKQYRNHPVLFVGTGLSLRYLETSYSWDKLLEKISVDISGEKEKYLDIKYKNRTDKGFDYPGIGLDLEAMIEEELAKDRNGPHAHINDIFYKEIENDNSISRFKIIISKLLEHTKYKEDMAQEIKKFKAIRKNIGSVVTTNYDTMVDDLFEFTPLIGNDILLSNPYGSIYKIHGSVNDPNKIIVTSKDYEKFQKKYELIRAQLLSLFIHHPIIFIGYSIQDENIQKILETIFTYVEPNSELSNKLRSNFLLVEYEEGSNNEIVSDCDIVLDNNRTVRINKIKTDNYSNIYDQINSLMLPVSAMDIKKVQDVVQEIYSGGDIEVRFTEDIDELHNSDKVIAIGSTNTIRYTHKNASQLLAMYFDIMDDENSQIISIIDEITIPKTQYFTIYGFSMINPRIDSIEYLKSYQDQKIQTRFDDIHENLIINHNSISEVIDDSSISISNRTKNIFYNIHEDNIELEELEEYLRKFENKKEVNYKMLLCLYDYKRYK